MTNDLDIWDGEVPFIANGDGNFDLWSEGDVPYLDQQQSEAPAATRRRSFVIAQTSS